MKIGLNDTLIEDYMKEIREIKTLQDAKSFAEKFAPYLDDGEEVFALLDESNFDDFMRELPKAFVIGDAPSDEWMKKFSAACLPYLHIFICPFLKATGKPSGFIITRMLFEQTLGIYDGKLFVR